MIKGAEDLPQRALYSAVPLGDETKEDRNSGGWMARTVITGLLGPVTGRISLEIDYNGGIYSVRP
jgi:hypothetical protein